MIPAVILSAGKSTRMGSAKALLPIDSGETFLTRIILTMQSAEVEDIVVVLGHQADEIAERVVKRGLAPRLVINADYESGQLSSLLTGLRAIDRPGVTAVLLTLVDVPLVGPGTVRAVLDRYRAAHPPIVRPVDRLRHGHPIVIDRTVFDEIRRADPSIGAKPIIRSHVSSAGDVPVADEGAFCDIDTPEDYARLVGERLRLS